VKLVLPREAVLARPANNVIVVPVQHSSTEQVRSITWYGPGGNVVPTVKPAADATWQRALAARTATIRASVIAQDARIPDRAPAALIHNFAVFGGRVSSSGITIANPALSTIPFVTLQLVDNPRGLREVRTTSGLRFWVDPGPINARGINDATHVCLREASAAALCANRLAPVFAHGLWAVTRLRDGSVVLYGIVPRSNRTVTLRLRGGRTKIVPVVHGVVVAPAAGVVGILVKGVDGRGATAHVPGTSG
jgi:hypothetical protein